MPPPRPRVSYERPRIAWRRPNCASQRAATPEDAPRARQLERVCAERLHTRCGWARELIMHLSAGIWSLQVARSKNGMRIRAADRHRNRSRNRNRIRCESSARCVIAELGPASVCAVGGSGGRRIDNRLARLVVPVSGRARDERSAKFEQDRFACCITSGRTVDTC